MVDEKAVLEKLNIPDFRHVSKDNVLALVSEINNADPEVALKIIEQIPELSNYLLESLGYVRDELSDILEKEHKSEQSFLDISNREIDILEAQLNDDLSFDQKLEICDRIDNIRTEIKEHHTEKRHFLIKVGELIAGTVVGLGAIIVSAIGVKQLTTGDSNSYRK